PIPLHEMGYATSIYSLTRNIGGSFGIAFATALQARRAQFHQNILAAHVTSTTAAAHGLLQSAQGLLLQHGIHPADAARTAMALLYATVQRQALYFSYMDVFRVFGWIFFAGIPLLWLMNKPRSGQKPRAPVH